MHYFIMHSDVLHASKTPIKRQISTMQMMDLTDIKGSIGRTEDILQKHDSCLTRVSLVDCMWLCGLDVLVGFYGVNTFFLALITVSEFQLRGSGMMMKV